jgi:NodT family efflux transporter outer membrane factor (OMF) lipoprotein
MINMNNLNRLLVLIIAFALVGCAVGPDFFRPDTVLDASDRFEADLSDQMSTEGDTYEWWKDIDDPRFSSMVETLLSDNLTIQQAGQRVIQAKEQVSIQEGGLWPGLSADGQAQRQFSPAENIFGLGGAGTRRIYDTTYTLQGQTNWEIDLFGRIRRSVEGAEANLQANKYDKIAITQRLIADLLRRRIGIATNQRLLELSIKTAENQAKIVDLVQRRFDLGIDTSRADNVLLARETLKSFQADRIQFYRQIATEKYQIDVLLGRRPGTTALSASYIMLPPPDRIPLCLPIDLLDRRPDLRRDEFRLRAANADIGVAMADLYPNVNLSATLGFTGSRTDNFFTADRLLGSILSNLTAPVFDGGQRRARVRLEKAEYRELATRYAERALTAIQEVETALTNEEKITQELADLSDGLKQLRESVAITKSRYEQGIATLRQVLESQQRLYALEQRMVRTQQRRWEARINLYLALGGGWTSNGDGRLPACQNTKGTTK